MITRLGLERRPDENLYPFVTLSQMPVRRRDNKIEASFVTASQPATEFGPSPD
jgi:hypothetical protein